MRSEGQTIVERLPLAGRIALVGLFGLTIAYTVIFATTTNNSWNRALLDAVINVVPLGLWGFAFFSLNDQWLLNRRALVQTPLQLVAATGFALCWYFTVTILLGWRSGDFTGSFSVRPFSTVAFVWQLFQGIVIYALVTALAVIDRLERTLSAAESGATTPSQAQAPSGRRILVRVDDELVPIAIDSIIRIERAGDYAELTTVDHRYLTRKSLTEFERQLPEQGFIRIHRSHLINLDALEGAEPIGGGRLRARLRGGATVDSSRSGAKALRARVS